MRLSFIQGLVSSETMNNGLPNFLTTDVGGIRLRASNRPIVFTVADGQKNYTITITTDVLAYSASLFNDVTEAWLYLDVNRATGAVSYGITTLVPVTAPNAPTGAVVGQHWFDTTHKQMKVRNNVGTWQHVLRVLVGHYTTTDTSAVAFGTQVGIQTTSVSGSIVFDIQGRPLGDSSGGFVTTEDVMLVDGAATHALKLESNIDVAQAAETIPEYHVVRYRDDGTVELADYDHTGNSVLGMAIVDALQQEPVSLVLQGKVHNELWNWAGANITLWVNQHGMLVPSDPYDLGGRSARRVPVARTLDQHTILFDQGLGGVGERGPAGNMANIAKASGSIAGITKLSLDPEVLGDPIAVGTNDPRLTDPRLPLDHTHPATSITTSPFGTFNGATAQAALEHLQNVKLNLSGGTVTGNVVSTVQATQSNHLITLGQASAEIVNSAVTFRRLTLDPDQITIVQALNATSQANRTLPTNMILIVEWKGSVYLWTGGAGAPVQATDSGQFALIGVIQSAPPEVNPSTLEIRTMSGVMTFPGDPIALLVRRFEVMALNLTTGELNLVPSLPGGDFITRYSKSNRLLHVHDNDHTSPAVILPYARGTTWTALPTITEYAPSKSFGVNIGQFEFCANGNRYYVTHPGVDEGGRLHFGTVFDSTTNAPILQVTPVDNFTETRGDIQMSLNPTGSIVAIGYSTSTAAENESVQFNFALKDVNTGAELIRYPVKCRSVCFDRTTNKVVFTVYDLDLDGAGTEFFVIDAANPPASLPQPIYTFPQGGIVTEVVVLTLAGVQYALISTRTIDWTQQCIKVNLNTGTTQTLVIPAIYGPVWKICETPVGNSVIVVTNYSFDAVHKVDLASWTITHTYENVSPAQLDTTSENYINYVQVLQ